MKIWIDFINSPQVSFFEPLITELSLQGHEFILTCRDSSNTVQLVKQKGWRYEQIGDRVESSLLAKALHFPVRIWRLFEYLKPLQIDIAVCQSSFYLPLTAKLLGVPSVYTNDNEYALGNIPAFLFATKILVPESIPISKITKRGGRKKKVRVYPGIKEGIYLWKKGLEIQTKRDSNPQRIFIRPEPATAQYYTGERNFLDDLILELAKKHPVVVLTRDEAQIQHYRQAKFTGISVPFEPLTFQEVATKCMLFIGAGGSMTREMALIGIPTISVYQGSLLEVDKVLVAKQLMLHENNLTVETIEQFLEKKRRVTDDLLQKGKQAYTILTETLLST